MAEKNRTRSFDADGQSDQRHQRGGGHDDQDGGRHIEEALDQGADRRVVQVGEIEERHAVDHLRADALDGRIVEIGHVAVGEAGGCAARHHLLHPRLRRRRDGDDHLLRLRFRGNLLQFAQAAENRQRVAGRFPLVIIDKADRQIAHLGIALQSLDDALAGLPRAEDEHPPRADPPAQQQRVQLVEEMALDGDQQQHQEKEVKNLQPAEGDFAGEKRVDDHQGAAEQHGADQILAGADVEDARLALITVLQVKKRNEEQADQQGLQRRRPDDLQVEPEGRKLPQPVTEIEGEEDRDEVGEDLQESADLDGDLLHALRMSWRSGRPGACRSAIRE